MELMCHYIKNKISYVKIMDSLIENGDISMKKNQESFSLLL